VLLLQGPPSSGHTQQVAWGPSTDTGEVQILPGVLTGLLAMPGSAISRSRKAQSPPEGAHMAPGAWHKAALLAELQLLAPFVCMLSTLSLGVAPAPAAAATAEKVEFSSQSTIEAHGRLLVSMDFDGDGAPDIATADSGLGQIDILLNLGDGTFAPAMVLATPPNARDLAAGDVDGDGNVDLILVRAGPGATGDGIVTILLNSGGASFAAPLDYPVLVSTVEGQKLTPFSVTTTDLDADGDLDLAVATVLLNVIGQPGAFSLVLNGGNDDFGEPLLTTSTNVDSQQSYSRSIVADDFDDDGSIDLAVANRLENSISILLSDGDIRNGSVRVERIGGDIALPLEILAGDVNDDSFVDLVTINEFHTYSVFLNLQGGTDPGRAGRFHHEGQVPLGDQGVPPGDLPAAGALADMDGDGTLDLVAGLVGDRIPGALAVLGNAGLGGFEPESYFGDGLNFAGVTLRDLNRDGKMDVASTQPAAGTVTVLLAPEPDAALMQLAALLAMTRLARLVRPGRKNEDHRKQGRALRQTDPTFSPARTPNALTERAEADLAGCS
jgi:hypothetical protein